MMSSFSTSSAGVRVHLLVSDAVAGLLVELMEADLLALRRRRVHGDRAGDERELQVAFPVRTRGHGLTPYSIGTERRLNEAAAPPFPFPLCSLAGEPLAVGFREGLIRGCHGPAAAKAKLKTFHATMRVIRTEEWCVDAETPEEARALLAAGAGHRCSVGDCLNAELETLDE